MLSSAFGRILGPRTTTTSHRRPSITRRPRPSSSRPKLSASAFDHRRPEKLLTVFLPSARSLPQLQYSSSRQYVIRPIQSVSSFVKLPHSPEPFDRPSSRAQQLLALSNFFRIRPRACPRIPSIPTTTTSTSIRSVSQPLDRNDSRTFSLAPYLGLRAFSVHANRPQSSLLPFLRSSSSVYTTSLHVELFQRTSPRPVRSYVLRLQQPLSSSFSLTTKGSPHSTTGSPIWLVSHRSILICKPRVR